MVIHRLIREHRNGIFFGILKLSNLITFLKAEDGAKKGFFSGCGVVCWILSL